MEHLEFATRTSKRNDIDKRLGGKFYTPDEICCDLANLSLGDTFQPEVIADPFCGDGRLLVAWLKRAFSERPRALLKVKRILLWDYDATAVKEAQSRLMALQRDLGLSRCAVVAETCDTFEKSLSNPSSIDLVLTRQPDPASKVRS